MFTIEDVPIRRWGWVVKYGQVPKLGGQVSSSMVKYGKAWSSMIRSSMVKYGQVWSSMVKCGQVWSSAQAGWSSMVKCPSRRAHPTLRLGGQVWSSAQAGWSSMVKYGQVWSSMVKYGQVWSSAQAGWSSMVKCPSWVVKYGQVPIV